MAAQKSWYYPTAIARSVMLQPRTYCGVLAGLAAGVLLPWNWPPTTRALLAWDIGAVVYLALAFRLMLACSVDHLKQAAAKDDDSRVAILVLILLSIGASFVSIAHLIQYAKQPSIGEGEKAFLTGLGLATMVLSWLVTQVAFTLHYAHEYYVPDDDGTREGLDFPGDEEPDYWDFFYFATSIGATSQTSDTVISAKSLRRLVTLHAVISFFFNTAVLALTVNIAASAA